MRITEFDIPQGAVVDNGLDRITMRRLGSVVVLAGANGSGKTRLLEKIRTLCKARLPLSQFQQLEVQLANIRAIMLTKKKGDVQSKRYETRIREIETKLGSVQWIKYSVDETPVKCLDWVPKHLALQDSNSLSRSFIIRFAQECEELGFERLHERALARIQHFQNLHWEVTHQAYKGDKREDVEESYDRLVRLLKDVLNSPLGRDEIGNALIFGRPLAQAGLSDGQKVLLQFCVGLHAQGGVLGNTILLMDEPENHLHPSVIVDVITRIQECLGDGQLWIATHSLPLIAQFEPDAVWYMENGRISHAGQTPEKVLNGLIGGEERAHKLLDFVDLPASYAANRFASQCLLPATTAGARDGDPQMAQVTEVLGANAGRRILDFGAGQGRLASALLEGIGGADQAKKSGLDYVAYDVSEKDKAACEAAIAHLHGAVEGRWFNNLHRLIEARGERSFDIVVMCNVLHEIDPVDWLSLFAADGPLVRLIADEGFLLIVEDERMPVGEKAYSKGFLVLGTDEIRTLFGVDGASGDLVVLDARGDGRLKAHLVPRKCLGRISPESRLNVLKHLGRRAQDTIRALRREKPNYQNGRLHAFWAQQWANANLALAEQGESRAVVGNANSTD